MYFVYSYPAQPISFEGRHKLSLLRSCAALCVQHNTCLPVGPVALDSEPCCAQLCNIWCAHTLTIFCKELFEHPWNILAQNHTSVRRPWACLLHVQSCMCSQGFVLLALLVCSLLTEIPPKSTVSEGLTINIPEQTTTQDSNMCFGFKSLCRIP